MSRNSHGMYRFALYGRSGSGKSCVLGTLALGAIGHPASLTVQRMPVTVSPPGGNKESWTPEQLEAAGLHRGREWIDQAMQALEKGDVPPANPATFDNPPPLVDYQIGSPERGEFHVRTIDYSGELINPDEEDTGKSTANTLKECLREFDGFVILAETPRAGEEASQESAEELRRLREAFTSLRDRDGALLDTPVAVVLTKWDRYSEIDFDHPETERDRLQEFLNSHPIHASLVDAIRNALIEQADESETDEEKPNSENPIALAAGNCQVFPSSAFGRAVRHDNKETPISNGQRPFALLDPLVWLADRRDNLDATRLQGELAEIGSFWDWLLWRFRRLRGIRSESKSLFSRMPRRSRAARTLRQVRRTALARYSACLLAWLAVIGVFVEAGYEAIREWQFDRQVAVVEDPQSNEAQLLAARGWFRDYRLLPWNGFFTPFRRQAKDQQDMIDDTIDDQYWNPVDDAETQAQEASAAQTYLDRLPNGPNAADARRIIADWKSEQKKQENVDWLTTMEQDAEDALATGDLKELEQALDNLGEFPHPDPVFSESLVEPRRAIENELSQEIAKIQAAKMWREFVDAYNIALSQEKFGHASNLLAEWALKDKNVWQELVLKFPEKLSGRVDSLITRFLKERRYQSARSQFDEAKTALETLEQTLRPMLPELADQILAGQRVLQPIGKRVDEREDNHLYERVQDQKDQDACTRYLDDASVGSMNDIVRKYLDYLNALKKPRDVTISAKIFWGKAYKCEENDHQLTVRVDDKTVDQVKSLTSTPNELSGEVSTFTLEGTQLSESIEFRADIIEKDFVSSHDDAGSGKATFRLSDFLQEKRKEKTIKLTPSDAAGFVNELRLKIKDGIPHEPELPEWKSR